MREEQLSAATAKDHAIVLWGLLPPETDEFVQDIAGSILGQALDLFFDGLEVVRSAMMENLSFTTTGSFHFIGINLTAEFRQHGGSFASAPAIAPHG